MNSPASSADTAGAPDQAASSACASAITSGRSAGVAGRSIGHLCASTGTAAFAAAVRRTALAGDLLTLAPDQVLQKTTAGRHGGFTGVVRRAERLRGV